jgi:hypothetical protein
MLPALAIVAVVSTLLRATLWRRHVALGSDRLRNQGLRRC